MGKITTKPGPSPLAAFVNSVEQSGLEPLGRYYSRYKAWVYDNADPENLCRLRLIIPDVTGNNPLLDWVYPIGQFAGVSDQGVVYGSQNIPERGDLVYVSFEHGDIRAPMWEGGYRAEDEVIDKPEFVDVNSRWFVTPKGHGVLINDTNDSINIFHANGQKAILDSEGISLVSDKKISLGTQGESAEPAVLGNKNAEVLDKIYSVVNKLHQALLKDTLASATAGVPFLQFTNLTSELPGIVADLADIKQSIDPTKSKVVTLD